MARTPLKRRLAAIMATDVVGYSRLMEADEEATLASVKAMQEELIRPNVEREGGRVFKLMGDGTLAVFDSVNGAVECAIAIQGELMRQPEGSRLILRIGINLADVLVDGTDLFGDGVNVASRIEASAFPGGISITDGVYHQIAKRTGTDFVDGGERVLKNIDRPVRVWHWQPRYNGFVEEERPRPADGAIAKTAVRITAAPSTAPQQLDLAELVVSSLEDLLTEQRWLDVSRVGSASAALDGSAIRPYDYTVKIGIHGAGPFRVNAKFLHTNVTPVMWSRAFDLPESYHFDVVELVAAEIGSLVQDKVLLAASEMIAKKPQSSWSADENFLYGRMLDSKHMLPEAEVFFLRATELDPGMIYAQASYAIALTYSFAQTGDFEHLRRADEIVRIALRIDNNDALSHYAAALVHLLSRDYDGARSHYGKARDLAPSDLQIRADHAEMLHYLGDLEQADAEIGECFRLAKYPPVWFWVIRGIIRLHQGCFGSAIEDFENIPWRSWRTLILLAAAYALHGDEVRRRQYQTEALSLQPALGPELVRNTFPYRDQDALSKLLCAFVGTA